MWAKMNEENRNSLWKAIQTAGDALNGKLTQHRNHPQGRNSYAHVAKCVKSKFGSSYKDIPDEKFEDVLDFIVYLVDNPY